HRSTLHSSAFLSSPILSIFSLFFFYSYCDHLYLHSFPTRRSSDLYMHNRPHAISKTNEYLHKPCSVLSYYKRSSASYVLCNHLSTKFNCVPLFVQGLVGGCPYQCLGRSLMGFTGSTKYVSLSYRRGGTCTGLIPYL